MSQWLILERLENNDLPLPQYATDRSVGVDFSACLTRPCLLVDHKNNKVPFMACSEMDRKHFHKGETPPAPSSSPLLTIRPSETIMVPLGFKSEFGEDYVLAIHARSSTGLRGLMLANGTGIVDPDYRGELFACFFNRTNENLSIKHGQRVVQGILLQFERPVIKEGEVNTTQRGEGGFGSTGTMVRQVG